MFPLNQLNPHNLIVDQGSGDLDHGAQSPSDIRESLIKALLLVPLEPDSVTRIQLGDCFRRSLQSKRSASPYRLHTIISECKAGTIDRTSLEAKFFQHGGAKAVTCLAAAATDNKQIIPLLTSLSDGQLQCFISSIELITPHRDLLFIAETLDRKKPPRPSKRKAIPSVRTRRKIQQIGCPESSRTTVVKSAIGKQPCSVINPDKQAHNKISTRAMAGQCTKNNSEEEFRWSQVEYQAPQGLNLAGSVVQGQSGFACLTGPSTIASMHVLDFSASEVSNEAHVPGSQHRQTHPQVWEGQNGPLHSTNMLAATEDTCDRLNQYLHKTGTPEEQSMCHNPTKDRGTDVRQLQRVL